MTKSVKNASAKLKARNPNLSKTAKQPPASPRGSRNSKAATILAMLKTKNGATIAAIAASGGWKHHSVRGFLSGTVKKKLGREIVSDVVEGERRYRVAS